MAPAQEFRHLPTDRGMQRPAHADSNNKAQHAAGSGSTERRENRSQSHGESLGNPKRALHKNESFG